MTTLRKNQFEELIDAMMIEEVAGLDKDIRETLEGLPTEKKRMAILSILDKDRDMFMKIKRMVDDNDVTKAEHIKNLTELMRAYVRVGEVEKKTLGEVMTPQSLVNDMMDTLPLEVWSNPNLKWLDPCSGVGIFSGVIVERLMEGLKDAFPNDEERYKHIVENMIHVGELQPKNMFLFLAAFDPKDEYGMNVYTGSFLDGAFEEHAKNVWGVDKFDVIVQNPPYQELKDGNKKSSSLWDKFVKKALNICFEGGYMVAVHPGGWRNFGGKFKEIQDILKERQVLHININNYKKGFETFGAYTDYDYYCVRNLKNNNFLTKIIDIDGVVTEINILDLPFIPKCNIKQVISLVAKKGEEKVNILFNSAYHHQLKHMSKTQDNINKYPCAQNVNNKGDISCIWYSNTKERGHFGIPKVIFGRKNCGVFIDDKGEYGMAEDCGGIIDDINNLSNIYKALQNEYFIKNIMGFRESFGDKYNKKIIATFRKDFWKEFLD
jgi:hypothetical protein